MSPPRTRVAERTEARPARLPKLAVWKLTSCDGCQMSLVDLEDELLGLSRAVQVAYFPELTRADVKGPYDLSIVEGSITTPHEAERIREVRRVSKVLVAVGACATAGGIQALRNFMEVNDLARMVYASPEYIETLATSSAVSAHVSVDFELRGCPVDKAQLLETLVSFLHGRAPTLPTWSVCLECKQNGNVCVAVARGIPCLGPVTQAGCGALCPAWHRGCFGCFGPQEAANVASMRQLLVDAGLREQEVVREFRRFTAGARGFALGGRER